MVLGIELSQRAHPEHGRGRDGTESWRSTYLAAFALYNRAAGRGVDFSRRLIAPGTGCALANGCAGCYLPGRVHTTGY